MGLLRDVFGCSVCLFEVCWFGVCSFRALGDLIVLCFWIDLVFLIFYYYFDLLGVWFLGFGVCILRGFW